MLVLSRRKNEVVRIGDSIRLIITDVRGDKVRLAFDAPPDVRIQREEVYEIIQKENQEP